MSKSEETTGSTPVCAVPDYVKDNGYKAGDKKWDTAATKMAYFHDHFRRDFRWIYDNADCYEDKHVTYQAFIDKASAFHRHLGMHHDIEETFVFPRLAERMPQFQQETGEHVLQHKQIHDGLDKYEAYVSSCRKDPNKYDAGKLRDIMDSFEMILFQHLDEEVETLKGASMHKYWTYEELQSIMSM